MNKLPTFYPLILLVILSCFNLASQSSFSSTAFFGSPSLPLSNAFATQSGIVPIHRDDYGFYVNADLASHSSDASDDIPNPDTVPMMLSLYTPKTLLVNNCMNFSYYNCTSHYCDPMNQKLTNYSFINFVVEGYEASALVYLDYTYWSLQEFSMIANQCFSKSTAPIGMSRNGIIGLGLSDNNLYNYNVLGTFSVSFDANMTGGNLTFFDHLMTKSKPNTIEYSLFTTLDWQIIPIGNSVRVGNSSFSFTTLIALDINKDIIRFPYYIYIEIIKFLKEMMIVCGNETFRANCSYHGPLNELPNIELEVQNQTFILSPQLYVQNWVNSTDNVSEITLNLCGTSNLLTEESYVTEKHDNLVILDRNFMSQYYIVYNGSIGTMSILLCNSDPRPDIDRDDIYSNDKWVIVVFSCVALVVGGLIIWCCTRYCQERKNSRLIPSEELHGHGNGKALLLNENESSVKSNST